MKFSTCYFLLPPCKTILRVVYVTTGVGVCRSICRTCALSIQQDRRLQGEHLLPQRPKTNTWHPCPEAGGSPNMPVKQALATTLKLPTRRAGNGAPRFHTPLPNYAKKNPTHGVLGALTASPPLTGSQLTQPNHLKRQV